MAAWRELGFIFLLNTGISACLELGCVVGVATGLEGPAVWVLPAAIISQAGFLNLVPGLAALGWLLWRRKNGLVTSLLFALLQVALLADVGIFRLFRQHFGPLIWTTLTTPGASDSIRPGATTLLTVAAVLLAMLGFSFGATAVLSPRLARRLRAGSLLKTGFAVTLACALVERVTLAVVGLYDAAPGGCLRETLPFYQPLTIKTLARRLGFKARPASERMLPDARGNVNVPKTPLGPTASLKHPNIVLIAVEGGRWDALTEAVMPNTSRLARDSWRLQAHYATGNETLFGIFGLFYSIPGSYWNKILSQQQPSPWLDLLAGQNYELRILSCTDLNYPQFRPTVFNRPECEITDKWDGPHIERDRRMTDAFLQFLDRRNQPSRPKRPFFCFLFYDATHQPFEHPPEDALLPCRFKRGELNYGRLALEPGLSRELKNLFLNSMHYVDRQIGRVIDGVRQCGEFDQTIFVVVGDHGEEFGECGRFGHTSDFSRFQTQTFGVLRLPGEGPKVITNLTSHVDFEPTILAWMGVTNAVQDYSTGLPLQNGGTHSAVVVAGWQKTALVKKESTTIFMQSHTSFLNSEYQPSRSGDSGRPSTVEIANLTEAMRRFYK